MQEENVQQTRQHCLDNLLRSAQSSLPRKASDSEHISAISRLHSAYQSRIFFSEQTLDGYCNESLNAKELCFRDRNQVLHRHSRNLSKKTSKAQNEALTDDYRLNSNDNCNYHDSETHHCVCRCTNNNHANTVPIVVVSRLLVWRLGGSSAPLTALLLQKH